MKYNMTADYTGIQNPLFFKDNTRMLYGNAKKVMQELVAKFKT